MGQREQSRVRGASANELKERFDAVRVDWRKRIPEPLTFDLECSHTVTGSVTWRFSEGYPKCYGQHLQHLYELSSFSGLVGKGGGEGENPFMEMRLRDSGKSSSAQFF